MAIKIETTINNYLRLPVSDMPSNQPYQPKEAILAIKELPTGQRRDKLRTYFMAQYDPTSIDDSVRFETEEMS